MEWKKKAGFEVVCFLRKLLNDNINKLSLAYIFIQPPMVHFKPTKLICPKCQIKVKVYYTDTRKAYSLHIGEFKAHRTFMYCPDSDTAYSDKEFGKIVPPY